MFCASVHNRQFYWIFFVFYFFRISFGQPIKIAYRTMAPRECKLSFISFHRISAKLSCCDWWCGREVKLRPPKSHIIDFHRTNSEHLLIIRIDWNCRLVFCWCCCSCCCYVGRCCAPWPHTLHIPHSTKWVAKKCKKKMSKRDSSVNSICD